MTLSDTTSWIAVGAAIGSAAIALALAIVVVVLFIRLRRREPPANDVDRMLREADGRFELMLRDLSDQLERAREGARRSSRLSRLTSSIDLESVNRARGGGGGRSPRHRCGDARRPASRRGAAPRLGGDVMCRGRTSNASARAGPCRARDRRRLPLRGGRGGRRDQGHRRPRRPTPRKRVRDRDARRLLARRRAVSSHERRARPARGPRRVGRAGRRERDQVPGREPPRRPRRAHRAPQPPVLPRDARA